MKMFVLLALSISGLYASAQDLNEERTVLTFEPVSCVSSAPVIIDVISVRCQSGAPVNFAETVKPGQQLTTFDCFHLGNSTIYVEMNHSGSEYGSGNPPCPVGDVLQIEWNVRLSQ
jgi:hypothetical protein